MTAAERLEAALLDAAEALMEVVGVPVEEGDSFRPRNPVNGPLVDRGEVPDCAWRAAVYGLDVIALGLGVLDPEASIVSVEDGLAAMTRDAPPGGVR